MAMTQTEKFSKWLSKPENRKKQTEYMRKRRAHYRKRYLTGEIAYADVPKSYRYFADTLH